MSPQRILIVSNEALSDSVREVLEQRGFTVTVAEDSESADGELARSLFALVLVVVAAGIEGVELIKRMRATPTLKNALILVVAAWGAGAATLALSQGADAYEPRPLEAHRLLAAVERLLSRQAVVIK